MNHPWMSPEILIPIRIPSCLAPVPYSGHKRFEVLVFDFLKRRICKTLYDYRGKGDGEVVINLDRRLRLTYQAEGQLAENE